MLTLVGIAGLGGCDSLYLHYADCGYYDGARFDTLVLSRPVLNQEYAEQVGVFFDSDRRIEEYRYGFVFDGSLPPGLSYVQDRNNLFFEGTAISSGTYSFTITVNARYSIPDRDYFYFSQYCSYQTTRDYLLVVDPV